MQAGPRCVDDSSRPSVKYIRIFGPRPYGSLSVKKATEYVTGKEDRLTGHHHAGRTGGAPQ